MKLATSALIPALFIAASGAHAGETEQHLLRCSILGDSSARLGCFDALSKQVKAAEANVPVVAAAPTLAEPQITAKPTEKVQTPDTPVSRMTQDWELNPDAKRGRYALHPLLDNYMLVANQSNATNDRPFRAFRPDGYESKHIELTYQLSFKAKALEGVGGSPVDLWLAYTQKSFWQAYARQYSSPFRETNYQPEVMAVVPVNQQIGDVNLRFASIGLVHESNGQGSTLSRSWNRVYGKLGFESGNLGVTARVWKRLDNDKSNNDNPDITDYMGHGDVRIVYRDKGFEYTGMLRANLNTGRGAVQAGVAFPLVNNLKGYLQGFAGYGQSLIDYNYLQKSLGAGILMDF